MIQEIQLSAIDSDARNQMRDGIRDDVVDEYATAMRSGATFPPVVVFADGGNRYHLADGFHRVEAAKAAGIDVIQADVRDGDQRAARLYAAGANATHGLRRTNADKRRSVMALLEDDEWSQMSDREIARHCQVTHPFVGKLRASLESPSSGNGYQSEPERKWLQRLGVPDPLPGWGDRFQSLKESVRQFGVKIPVHIDQHGDVIDGVHRIRAWQEAKAEGAEIADYPRIIHHCEDDMERMDLFVSLNLIGRADENIELDPEWVAAFGDRYPGVVATYRTPDDHGLVTGRRHMATIQMMQVERMVDDLKQSALKTYPAMVSQIDEVRDLIPDQYETWLATELRLTPHDVETLRAAVDTGDGLVMSEAWAEIMLGREVATS